MKDRICQPHYYFRENLSLLFAFLAISLSASFCWALSVTSIPLTEYDQELILLNPSSEEEPIWLSGPSDEDLGIQDIAYNLAAHSTTKIDLSTWRQQPWLQLHSLSQNIQLSLRTNSGTLLWPWGSSSRLYMAHGLPQSDIWISNLNSVEQVIRLTGADNEREYLVTKLKPFETRKWSWRTLPDRATAGSLILTGEHRLAARLEDNLQHQSLAFSPLASEFKIADKPKTHARFVLENSEQTQSFVIELEDPDLIQQARKQVQLPHAHISRMLVARVEMGSHLLNYNPRDKWQTPWAWHVEQVYRFADFGSIDCDGNPELLEQTLNWWLKNRNGLICFWNYKIKNELP